MKFNSIIPLALLSTISLVGCGSSEPEHPMMQYYEECEKIEAERKEEQTNIGIYFPETSNMQKNEKYRTCYSNGGLILRGTPLSKNEKFYKREGRVAVFPAPRIPNSDINKVSPRDLYTNLSSDNTQVRSDTLFVIDKLLEDSDKKDHYKQIQAMLDDYLKKLEKAKEESPAEYDTAKKIYDTHFSEKTEKVERPNWNATEEKDIFTTIEDNSKTLSKPKIITGTPNNDVSGKPTELDKTTYTEVIEKNLNDDSVETETLPSEELPAFDFSDPKQAAFTEKTEIEKQIEVNKELEEVKKSEDAIIDKDLSSLPADADLTDWNCTQNMCATRLQENKTDVNALITASKIVLNDTASLISPRLYAICSMKCASQADKKYEGDVVEYLASYLRRRTPWIIPEKGEKEPKIKAVRPDVQAALYVIGARDRMKNVGFDINLIGTDLRGADLSYANLYNTNLSFTNLGAANMEKAYGLMDWNKIYLATIDVTTKIPQSISAGFVVVKKPQLPIQPAGSYTVTTDDWIYWTATPVK